MIGAYKYHINVKCAFAAIPGSWMHCEGGWGFNLAAYNRKYINRKTGTMTNAMKKRIPTMTDDESSIDVALEILRMRKTSLLSPTPIGRAQTEPVIPNVTMPSNLSNESETQIARQSFFERIKNKAVEIWHEIDSIVVE